MKTARWTCGNCGYEGGQLEEPASWKGAVVCPACERELRAAWLDSVASQEQPAHGKPTQGGPQLPTQERPTVARYQRVRGNACHSNSPTRKGALIAAISGIAVFVLVVGLVAYLRAADRQRVLAKTAREQTEYKQANAEVRDNVGYAKSLLADGYVDGAKARIERALSITRATDFAPALDLKRRIDDITDPRMVRARMMDLTDEGFANLQASGIVPNSLRAGISAGEQRVFDATARAVAAEVAKARQARRQQQLAQEQAEVEAAKKTKQEWEAQQRARAEAVQRDALEQKAKEEARAQAEKKAEQARLAAMNHSLGEEFQVGYWGYYVANVAWAPAVPDLFENLQPADPGTRFLVVGIGVCNLSKENAVFPMPKLVDRDGNVYDRSPKNWHSSEFSSLTTLNPLIPKAGVVTFEVPTERRPYKLLVSGGFLSNEQGLVDLGEGVSR